MGQGIPPAPPEAEVIRLARKAAGMTAEDAAAASKAHDPAGKGVSATYWRDVERGRGGRRGQQVQTRASDRILAAMARAVGVEPGQLTEAGREDGARVLAEILRREGRPAVVPTPAPPDAAILATLELGDEAFVDTTPELQRALQPHLAELRGRVAVLAQAEAARSGRPLADVIDRIPPGADLFPDSSHDAAAWDDLASRRVFGESLSVRQMIAGLAVLRARREEREQRGSGNGIAAGLRKRLVRA